MGLAFVFFSFNYLNGKSFFLNAATLVAGGGATIHPPATFGQSVGRVVEIHLEDEITVAAAMVRRGARLGGGRRRGGHGVGTF
jgi:hypothetical protein